MGSYLRWGSQALHFSAIANIPVLEELWCACLQAEGIAHVVQQLTNLQTVPNLDTPEYSVLKKTKVCRLTKCL